MDQFTILDQGGAAQASPAVTGASLEHIRRSAGWMKFVAIVQFVGVGFMILASLLVMTMGGALFANMPNGSTLASAGIGVFMGSFYLIFALLAFMPALYLYRSAVNYKNFVDSEAPIDLEDALQQQMNFWRYIGILTAIVVSIYAFFIVIAVLSGLVGMAAR